MERIQITTEHANFKMNNELSTTNGFELVAPTALEAIERANVDIQISTAHKFPRSLTVSKQKMLDLATLDQETAESCFYKLNRQGKSIEGPSIRLAEIAAASYGNLRYGARVISNDGKKITAQGFCHDLESNVLAAVEVSRRITDREGRTYSEDMQIVTGNAACAIALRNAMFKVVPFALVKPIFESAKRAAVGDIKTLAERRTAMLKKFAAMGVNEKRVCATVGKVGVDEIGLPELETLIGLHNAVRDGEQTVDEAFPEQIAKPTGLGAAATTEQKQQAAASDAKKTPRKSAKEKEPVAPPNGEQTATASPEQANAIREKLRGTKFTEAQVLTVAIAEGWAPEGTTSLDAVEPRKLDAVLKYWDTMLPELEKLPAAASERSPFDS